MEQLKESLIEIIRRTSAEIPEDVHAAILRSLEEEKKGTIAENALKIIDRNIALAKQKSQPICQDTGSIIFYVDTPAGLDQIAFEETTREAVKEATKKGYLRQNSVDSLTGVNDGTNVGVGSPNIHFHQHRSSETNVKLVLKVSEALEISIADVAVFGPGDEVAADPGVHGDGSNARVNAVAESRAAARGDARVVDGARGEAVVAR